MQHLLAAEIAYNELFKFLECARYIAKSEGIKNILVVSSGSASKATFAIVGTGKKYNLFKHKNVSVNY